MKKDFQRINIPKLPVLTTEDGIKRIKEFFGKLMVIGKNLMIYFQIIFYMEKIKVRTGTAGLFAGSLELTKEGTIYLLNKINYLMIFI